ncbi:hypothetical protein [Actinoallomurus sp. NPDC050550]|uniref:hypothetical protein n=1 Tax=Actinoallomurus sp. NPDC050550 TaxID=3154937 RepID=UPI0033DC7FAF
MSRDEHLGAGERAVSVLTEGVRAAKLRTQHGKALRCTLAESSATIYFAEKMLAEGPGRGDRAATAHHLQHAIETLDGFGWLATVPRLIDHAEETIARAVDTPRRVTGPANRS